MMGTSRGKHQGKPQVLSLSLSLSLSRGDWGGSRKEYKEGIIHGMKGIGNPRFFRAHRIMIGQYTLSISCASFKLSTGISGAPEDVNWSQHRITSTSQHPNKHGHPVEYYTAHGARVGRAVA